MVWGGTLRVLMSWTSWMGVASASRRGLVVYRLLTSVSRKRWLALTRPATCTQHVSHCARLRCSGQHGCSTFRGRFDVAQSLLVAEGRHSAALQQLHLGREGVVVADSHLLHSHSVILVDDGHHAVLHQLHQRVACIQVLVAVRDVVQGQQHLSTLLQQQRWCCTKPTAAPT